MKTLLTQCKGVQPPGHIAELLNLMVGHYTDELPRAENNRPQVPTTKALAEKRSMINKGTCDPFGALIPLGEDALSMGVSLATVKAPYLQALAHFDVCGRRRTPVRSRAIYLHVDRETTTNQQLDRVQHRVLRDENDPTVLRQLVQLADAQITETVALRDAALERIAELLPPAPLTVAVRWSARS